MIRPEDAYRPGAVPPSRMAALEQGVNIQGWSLWGEAPLSGSDMARIKADGFDHVRLYFDARRTGNGSSTEYPSDLSDDWIIARVEQTIAHALGAGLAVVINPTSGLAREDSPAETKAHIAFFQTYVARIAERFGTERIIIETTNEPSYASQADWAKVETKLIAAVRKVAPDMTVMTAANLISDGAWFQLGGLLETVPYRDDNIVYSVHTYFPAVFTSQSHGTAHWPTTPALTAEVGSGTVGWYYREGYGSEAALARVIDEFARTADALGIALHIGEFGVVNHAPDASRLAYFGAITQAFERHELGWSIWKSHGDSGVYDRGAAGLAPADPALLAALGLSGARPDAPLTVTFAAGSAHDLWATWNGAAFLPKLASAATLGPAQLGAAAVAPGASVSLARDAAGAVAVHNTGGWASVKHLGIADDHAGTVTASGFERSWVSLGGGGDSTVTLATMHHRVMTGAGDDHVRIDFISPVTANVGGTGYVSTGAGDDVITIGIARNAGNTGIVTARTEVWAGAGDDRIIVGEGVVGIFSGGSGDDVIIAGAGNQDLRGDAGIDTLHLPGPKSAWRFTLKSDAVGQYLEAIGPGGTDRLRGFEYVVFDDGTVARFGELWGDKAPTGLKLVTTALPEGALARATGTDPEGKPLTWFLSDTAGKRFAIDPYSGAITIRPGAAVAAGETYALGVAAVDVAGNVTGATLTLRATSGAKPADAPPPKAGPPVATLTLGNAFTHDGFAQIHQGGWTSEILAGSAVTLTAAALKLAGTAADARLAVSADAKGGISIALNSAWNGLKNVSLRDIDGGSISVANIVSVDVEARGGKAVNLAITDAKRGVINTGVGDDVITIAAVSNSRDGAEFVINAGAGDDRITLTSASTATRATIHGGEGDDVITGGPGNDVIWGDGGIDTVVLPGARAQTVFSPGLDAQGHFIRATGPGGTDILRSIEFVAFTAGGRFKAGELIGNASPTAITLLAGSTPGVLATARATDRDDASGFTWTISGPAASLFAINAATGAITAREGADVLAGTRYTLDLTVTDPWGNVFAAPSALTTPGVSALVTISNAVGPDLAPLYDPAWTGAIGAGTRTLSTGDLAGLGVAGSARVSLAADDAGGLAVAVLSAWNSVKNVVIEDANGGAVSIANAVHAGFIGTGSTATALTVTDAKRADLSTGSGNDTISVRAFSNDGGLGNTISIDAGAGDDTVTVQGHGSWTIALLRGGAGNDVLRFTGAGSATLDGGAGADVMSGGSGRDTFILRPGEVAGDRIEGFAGAGRLGGDVLLMEGFGAGAALAHKGAGAWAVSYVSSGIARTESFTLAGVSLLGADDIIWA